MSDEQKIDEVLERVEPGPPGRHAQDSLLGPMIYAAPVVASFSVAGLGRAASMARPIYHAILTLARLDQ